MVQKLESLYLCWRTVGRWIFFAHKSKIQRILTLIAISSLFAYLIKYHSPGSAPRQYPARMSLYTEKHSLAYDLPRLLNVSAIFTQHQSLPLDALDDVNKQYPKSFAAFYHAIPKSCTVRPFRRELQQALKAFGKSQKFDDKHPFEIAIDPNTLTVHLSIHRNDTSTDLQSLVNMVKESNGSIPTLQNILIVSQHSLTAKNAVAYLRKSLESSVQSVISFISSGSASDEDFRLFLVHNAKNLLVDDGQESALATYVSTVEQGVFTSPTASFLNHNVFRHSVRIHGKGRNDPDIDLIGDVIPTCCQFSSYGKGDGEKTLCSNAKNYASPTDSSCWFLSLGCRNKWSFEVDLFLKTNCHVQVFDCTGDFQVPPDIRSRVQVHKLCIGRGNDTREEYKTLKELVEIGSVNSGFPKGTAPIAVKMDVEGWEFPAISEMSDNFHTLEEMPLQIEFELHTATRLEVGFPWVPFGDKVFREGYPWDEYGEKLVRVKGEAILALVHTLYNMGYHLVHRADNTHCLYCTEITFLHQSAIPQTM